MYYAWFLNVNASKQLRFIANCLLRECAQQFPAFAERLLKQIHISPQEVHQWQQKQQHENGNGLFLYFSLDPPTSCSFILNIRGPLDLLIIFRVM
jgi:hypothetical protein